VTDHEAELREAFDMVERARAKRHHRLEIRSEVTPAIFEADPELLKVEPFRWPHHYNVKLTYVHRDYWFVVLDVIVSDVVSAIRAVAEGIELDVAGSLIEAYERESQSIDAPDVVVINLLDGVQQAWREWVWSRIQ
jgi:hypothetical protein